MIDAADGDADERWRTIDRELAAYGAGLDERPQVVVLNKIDLLPEPPPFDVEDDADRRACSASRARPAQGVEELPAALFALVPATPEPDAAEATRSCADFLVYRPQPRGARVPHPPHRPRLPRRRHARPATRSSSAALRAAGARRGDEVEVGDEELEFAVTSGLFGGAFDPPHNGHVALARGAATSSFGLDRLLVLVAADPGHKAVATPTRADCASSSRARRSPATTVELDDHARTSTCCASAALRRRRSSSSAPTSSPTSPTWKEPDAVLDEARLGVATRPGYPRERLDACSARLARPERVELLRDRAAPDRLDRAPRARRPRRAARRARPRRGRAS